MPIGGFVNNLIFSDIVPPNIVTLIKIFGPQKRAITYVNSETRFSQNLGIMNIKRIKGTVGHYINISPMGDKFICGNVHKLRNRLRVGR